MNAQTPDDLRTLLLHVSATPAGRAKVAARLRAALAVVDDDGAGCPEENKAALSPDARRALTELMATLARAAEQAEFLFEKTVTG